MIESRKRRENLTQEEEEKERHKKVRLGELQIDPAVGHEGWRSSSRAAGSAGRDANDPQRSRQQCLSAADVGASIRFAQEYEDRAWAQDFTTYRRHINLCDWAHHRKGWGWHRHWRLGSARSLIKVGSLRGVTRPHPRERIAFKRAEQESPAPGRFRPPEIAE
jgi:hypothetical protein